MSIYVKAIETVNRLRETSSNNPKLESYLCSLLTFLHDEKAAFEDQNSVDPQEADKEIKALKDAILNNEKTYQLKC